VALVVLVALGVESGLVLVEVSEKDLVVLVLVVSEERVLVETALAE